MVNRNTQGLYDYSLFFNTFNKILLVESTLKNDKNGNGEMIKCNKPN